MTFTRKVELSINRELKSKRRRGKWWQSGGGKIDIFSKIHDFHLTLPTFLHWKEDVISDDNENDKDTPKDTYKDKGALYLNDLQSQIGTSFNQQDKHDKQYTIAIFLVTIYT